MNARMSIHRLTVSVIAATIILGAPIAIAADEVGRDSTQLAYERRALEYARKTLKGVQKDTTTSTRGKPSMTPTDSTGLVPLTDMGPDERYKKHDGGLYGRGRNRPPTKHLAAAKAQLAQVRPLDAEGNPSPDGKVVMISMGMSNTRMAFMPFMALAAKDKTLSPHLVIVNGAVGGQTVTAWSKSLPMPRHGNITTWENLDQQLAKASVSPQQVQVAWVKHAEARPDRFGEFPAHAKKLSELIGKSLIVARKRYPNLRIAYISSRTYAGYATSPLNPEPYAYESAFSVQWLIERQVAGDEKLNYDPARGKVVAPLLLWGPYLWADGVKGRKFDKLAYKQGDFRKKDGTHPTASGARKVSRLMLKFFKTDPLTKTWFVAPKPAPAE